MVFPITWRTFKMNMIETKRNQRCTLGSREMGNGRLYLLLSMDISIMGILKSRIMYTWRQKNDVYLP